MNGTKVHGQEIKIGWGKAENTNKDESQNLPYGSGGGDRDRERERRPPDVSTVVDLPPMPPGPSLWIGNVTPLVNEPMLREVFSRFGEVESVRMVADRGCAYLSYGSADEAKNAKNFLDRLDIADTILRVNYGKYNSP